MKNKIVIILTITFFFLLIISFKYINEHSLINKREKEVILKTNGGVPYNWKCKVQNDKIATIKKQYSVDKADKNVVGGPVEMHFVVKAKKKGLTSLICRYESIVNNKADKINEYQIKVDKKLKLTLKERK